MSEKISTRELMRSMATHLGVSAAASAAFVEAFQEVFEEALLRDKVVKVNDLGTFKLTWHAPRRSVNVRTGEEMEIAGHYKISFLPDGGWGEKVNEPLAHLEAVELMGETPVAAPSVEDVDHELPEAASDEAPIDFEMPMQHLNEQVTEVKSILMDIMGESVEPEAAAPAVGETENLQQGETADESPVAESQPTAEPDAEEAEEQAEEPTAEPVAEEAEEQAEEPTAEPIAEEAEKESEEPTAEPVAEEAEEESEEPIAEPVAEEAEKESEEPTAEPVAEPTVLPIVEKPESSSAETAAVPSQPVGTKGNHRWIGWLVCTLLVLTLLGVGGYYYQTHPEAFSFLKPSESEALVAVQEPFVEDTIPVAVPEEIVYDSTYYFPPEMGNEIFDKPRKFDVFVAVRTITPEDRLVTLAKDYYGHKFFWVYIYEANRDIINHPNKLLVGQQIRVPKMAEELINLNDTACLSYVKKLGDSYVKR
ncbi:MAG: HU family DNA-binding protein [Paludibacteraceae bacterium]|nr:HU family DNA-binding protein [Paludibacteraceae bacterium]